MAAVDPYLGSIDFWAPNFAPRGWTFCAGQTLEISQYMALFSLIGTVYGGDGRRTFMLPDLRSRVPVGVGTGPGLSKVILGQPGGVEKVALTEDQNAAHNHTVQQDLSVVLKVATAPASSDSPGPGQVLGEAGVDLYASAGQANTTLGGLSLSGSITTEETGEGNVHENRQPFLGLNHIFCLDGAYPSRS